MKQRQKFAVSCRDLLSLPLLSASVVLAGEGGLGKAVRRINVMEVPDVTDWVRPGELLMTTGYPFRDQPGAFLKLIRELAEKGVVALGVKTKRFLGEIPADVIALANELQFPLIELPPQTVFSDVIHEVMEQVLHSEMRQLSVLQERMQAVTAVLLEGGEVTQMLDCLERQTGNLLMFVDSLTGIWSTEQGKSYSILWMPLQSGAQSLAVAERTLDAYVVSAELPGGRRCSLVLLAVQQPWTELDVQTMERTLPLIELEVLNIEARRSVEYKYKDQFVQDWLFGRLESLSELRMRADLCGFSIAEAAEYAVALIGSRDGGLELLTFRARLVELQASEIYVISFDTYLILLFPIGAANMASARWNQERIRRFAADLLKDGEHVCIGKTVEPVRVPESFAEAMKIEQISRECRIEKPVLRYDDLGIYPLLSVLPDAPEVQQFKRRYVQPLLECERSQNLNLVETLEAYFGCNQNMKQAAAKLFTHYNTVVYRMERIQALLGFDFDSAETRLNVFLALKLLQLEKIRNQ